ncbi:DNA repair protein XRCC3 homolog [Salvia miltiorrhiza]|uniref:DNA repair protein XRCC3 homolog n=1 Tax=Salvia miltiorrhiza TaxID=226208 RepID=UPI0025ACF691|nr:DNA repair protein XRCC3 homolog [Salvia miltiorrhiza]
MVNYATAIPLLPLATPKITFGCPTLDRMFGGGIPVESITEFVGESGCGKTQFMLQLAQNTQLPETLGGQSRKSLYLNAEFAFPIERLNEIASNNPFFNSFPLDRVFIKFIECVDELLRILAVVVTNQVVDTIDGNDQVRIDNIPSITTSDRTVVCVNTHFVIVKLVVREKVINDKQPSSSASEETAPRSLQVVFAPHIGKVNCEIVINHDGISGIGSA